MAVGEFSVMFTWLVSLFKKAKAAGFYTIFFSWYMLIMGTAAGIVIFLIKNDKVRAKLDQFFVFVKQRLNDIETTVASCTSYIDELTDISRLLDCL